MIFGDVLHITSSPQWQADLDAVLDLFQQIPFQSQMLTTKQIQEALPEMSGGRINRILQNLTVAGKLLKSSRGGQLSRLRYQYQLPGGRK